MSKNTTQTIMAQHNPPTNNKTDKCQFCHNFYNPHFMPWEFVNNNVDTDFTKKFFCPNCKSVLIIE